MKNIFAQHMYPIFRFLKTYTITHPYVAGTICILCIAGTYWGYGAFTSSGSATQYAVTNVSRGTIIVSVTGSGQIAAQQQVDIKAKTSGDVYSIPATSGQTVKAGAAIAYLDATDAQKAVRDAQINLESSQLSLKKLQQPTDELSLMQQQNALAEANSSLDKAYIDSFNSISDAFLDLPNVMSTLQNVLYGTTVYSSQDNISAYTDMARSYDSRTDTYKQNAVDAYANARAMYDATYAKYKNTSRLADTKTVQDLLNDSYKTTVTIADALKDASDTFNFVKDTLSTRERPIPSSLTSHLSTLGTLTNTTNSHVSALLTLNNTIRSATQTIAEQTVSLAKLEAGTDALDIQSAQLSVRAKENALRDAEETLSNSVIRAPFDGTIAKISIKKADSVSNGSTVATMITTMSRAEIPLNEVDAAKVKVGQKATLTFDAIDDLSITGTVATVDSIGTVSQGVVTYTVSIAFDVQDTRIKPGMTVNASIQTEVKSDILFVPSSAIKTIDGQTTVSVFEPPITTSNGSTIEPATTPSAIPVVVGISNDTQTEIISGVSEGTQVVTRTIQSGSTASKQTTTSSNTSILRAIGGGGPTGR